eukprot:TRINITY_DN29757_c0_g1_i1.p1 TRINITY_DN29757_c0_g1~~TRINITY_DN29757_c0_g1_i1.p1  ORF type:complete len:494 (+),score=160.91 TRINITY_DN29757_c0_g1_i1:60-1541(+)
MLAMMAAAAVAADWHERAEEMNVLRLGAEGRVRGRAEAFRKALLDTEAPPAPQTAGCWVDPQQAPGTMQGTVAAWFTKKQPLGTGAGLKLACLGGSVTSSLGSPTWGLNIVATDSAGKATAYPAAALVNASTPYEVQVFNSADPATAWTLELKNDNWLWTVDYDLRYAATVSAAPVPTPAPPSPMVYSEAEARAAAIYASAAYAPPDAVKNWALNQSCNDVTPGFANQTVFSVQGHGIYEPFGYAGLDHPRKWIVVAFKGTNDTSDVLADLVQVLSGLAHYDYECHLNEHVWGHAHKGFCLDYLLLQQHTALVETVLRWMGEFAGYKVMVTGHSMGASLAHLFRQDMITRVRVTNPAWEPRFVGYTMGAPRTGDYQFGESSTPFFRLTHEDDVVVHLVPCCSAPGQPCTRDARCPYHSAMEVFYPGDMAPGATFKTCNPNDGEDMSCSNSVAFPISVDHHKHYFQIRIGQYCVPPLAWKAETARRRSLGLPPP